MANNPIKPGINTAKSRYQTNGDDRISWKDEGKMATKFYGNTTTPAKDRMTSGEYCYGDAKLQMLPQKDNRMTGDKGGDRPGTSSDYRTYYQDKK